MIEEELVPGALVLKGFTILPLGAHYYYLYDPYTCEVYEYQEACQ